MASDKLLSSGAKKCLRIGLKYSEYFGSTPYKWNDKGGGPEGKWVTFIASGKRRIVCISHSVIYISYLVFVFSNWIRLVLTAPRNDRKNGIYSPKAMGAAYIWCAYSFLIPIQWSIWKRYGQHHRWINSFLTHSEQFKGLSGNNLESFVDCYKQLKSLTISIFLILILDTLSLLEKPYQPYFLSSMVTESEESPGFLMMIPFVLFHLEVWLHMYGTCFIYAHSMMCHVTVVRNTLHNFCETAKEGFHGPYMTSSFVTEYRRLGVIQSLSNYLWSTTNAMYETVLVMAVILSCYGSVRLDGSRAVQQGSVALILSYHLTNLFENMGEIYESSYKVLKSWQLSQIKNLLFQRQLKGMRPIRVNVGAFFYADRNLKKTILSIIFMNTSSLLLSTS